MSSSNINNKTSNSNSNNGNNKNNNKRKQQPRSSLSSSSSVSSVSSGESDASQKTSATRTTKTIEKSVFAGFWTDSEIVESGDSNNNNNNISKNKDGSSVVDYEGFYLTIGDTVYEIGVGDVVAMRNSFEADFEHDNGDNSRKRRSKRRLERDRVRNNKESSEEAVVPPAPPIPSSEYTTDEVFEKSSDYYKASPRSATTADGEKPGAAPQQAEGNSDNNNDIVVTTDGTKSGAKDAGVTGSLEPRKPQAAAAAAVATATTTTTKVAKVGDTLMLARVERIWQEKRRGGRRSSSTTTSATTTSTFGDTNGGGKVLFKARWFLKKEDVDSLPLGELTGPVSSDLFAGTITEHDLVLSNQSDDNHVTTICDLIQVLYRNPNLDDEMPSLVLPTTYLCRYSLRIDNDSRVVILPYTGDNDDWNEMTVSAIDSRKRHVDDPKHGSKAAGQFLQNHMSPRQSTSTSLRSPRDPDTNTGITASGQKRRRVGDFATEEVVNVGVIEQRDIQVGSEHQVSVPVFLPNQEIPRIVSRNPIRMWKPDQISQEGTDDYIEKAARILTPYLRKHNLTQEEPYAPFPTKRMEELSLLLSKKRLPTLSSVSSVSSLTTHKVDALREFNVDALLRNLHVSNYNVRAAIAAIEASPIDYLLAWSPHEKVRFNTGFRRYSGSLRAIYKGLGNKALTEVIDYHYRFKIPDQFRKVQERKREQAIRMLECIETKRNLNAPIVVSTSSGIASASGLSNPSSGVSKEKGDWTITGSSSLVVSIEERRIKAKELLLDVDAKLGRNKMMRVFDVFKHADETTINECKIKLLEIFQGHQDFQSRFLEFLPQELRL